MLDGRSTQIGSARPPLHTKRPLCPLFLRPRMKLAMHSLQPLLIHVSVDLCCRYIGVPEHLLNDSQIRAIAEQVRREAVPQKVRINALLESGPLRVLLNDLPDPRCG